MRWDGDRLSESQITGSAGGIFHVVGQLTLAPRVAIRKVGDIMSGQCCSQIQIVSDETVIYHSESTPACHLLLRIYNKNLIPTSNFFTFLQLGCVMCPVVPALARLELPETVCAEYDRDRV